MKNKKKTSSKPKSHPFEVGENYLIRTVTMIQVGKLNFVSDKELVLEDAAWVADTGRFSEFLAKGPLNSNCEIEPFPEGKIIIGRLSIIDAVCWTHGLLRQVK